MSALATEPLPSLPPTTSTRPSGSSVAVASALEVAIESDDCQVPVDTLGMDPLSSNALKRVPTTTADATPRGKGLIDIGTCGSYLVQKQPEYHLTFREF